MALPSVNLTKARNLSPIFDELVRTGRPRLITRGRRDRALLLSLESLERLLEAYTLHVSVIPEELGGFTLWLRELDVLAYGPTLKEARAYLLSAVRAYVEEYVERYHVYRLLPEMARLEPYVTKLSLAEDDQALLRVLFGAQVAAAPAEQEPANS